MGTWGTGPFDNDAAGDMVAALARRVNMAVGAKTDTRAQGYYYEARAAVQLVLVAHGTDILGGPGLDVPLRALARMRSDVEWLAGFREPKKLAKMLENEMAALLARMLACKGCRRTNDKDELRAIVDKASATKVLKSTWPLEGRRFRARRKKRKTTARGASKRRPHEKGRR